MFCYALLTGKDRAELPHGTIRVKWTHAKELKQKGNAFIFTGTYCTSHNLLMLSYSLKHTESQKRQKLSRTNVA